MNRRIAFTVTGIAQPQGSAKAFVHRTKAGKVFASVTHDNTKLRGWRDLVASAAQAAIGDELFLDAVMLTVTFRLPRPPTIPKKRLHPTVAPDLDKLIRAVGDGLTGIAYLDDKQIVEVRARKIYCSGARPPAAFIVVESAAPTDLTSTPHFAFDGECAS